MTRYYTYVILIVSRLQKERQITSNQSNPSKYLGNELEYLKKVLDGESWSSTGGSWVNNLERSFAKRFNRRYAVAFNSGTATLHAALVALGAGPGDEVISPGLTVIMDTTATLHAGATPVYADVDPVTFNINPADVARKITSKTKAIIAVSLYGAPYDVEGLRKVAGNIPIIEDNAQAVLSYDSNGNLIGTQTEIASFSFENTKHISCGEGGMIVTDSEELAEKCRKIGGHGFKNLRADEGRIRLNQEVFQDPDYKRHDTLGWNYRLSEFQAAVALAQLERVEQLVLLRKQSAAIIIDSLESFFTVQKWAGSSYYTLAALYDGPVSWQEFRAAFVKNGGDGIYAAWSVPYLEPFMNGMPGLCPIAENLQRRIMQFKTNYRNLDLARRQADILRKTIRGYL